MRIRKDGIAIAHEAPVSIMPLVQQVTDYDYALSVLFDKVPGYYDFFVDAKKKGRWVLLDNGIFEEGVPMEASKYADWITKLYPDEYVVPDALEDINKTIANFDNWLKDYGDVPGRRIGVVQGENFNELLECYHYMSEKADKIAISFDYKAYLSEFKGWPELVGQKVTKWEKFVAGRASFIENLAMRGMLNLNKPHHLLGVSLSYEFGFYAKGPFPRFIESLDTSAPVVYAIINGQFPRHIGSQTEKVSVKLKDLIATPKTDKLVADTIFNIAQFRLQNNLQ
jgi:hypothetical protein